jgi:hypothetical protein
MEGNLESWKRQACLEIALNMLVMSSASSARELCSGNAMKVVICACVEWQMKSKPPEMACQVDHGVVRFWQRQSQIVAAVMCRNAVLMPIGQILSRLQGSLCKATTYCAAK